MTFDNALKTSYLGNTLICGFRKQKVIELIAKTYHYYFTNEIGNVSFRAQ